MPQVRAFEHLLRSGEVSKDEEKTHNQWILLLPEGLWEVSLFEYHPYWRYMCQDVIVHILSPSVVVKQLRSCEQRTGSPSAGAVMAFRNLMMGLVLIMKNTMLLVSLEIFELG